MHSCTQGVAAAAGDEEEEEEEEGGQLSDADEHDAQLLAELHGLGWVEEVGEAAQEASPPPPPHPAPSNLDATQLREAARRLKQAAVAAKREGRVQEARDTLRRAKEMEAQAALVR